ncbi:MAG TPA: N-acetylmuramoyl-L-alanine amidase [Terriglobales bacterium]|nr:N-acetylmuramoyl-L-alanine amidase [Terriglobales bacterium]
MATIPRKPEEIFAQDSGLRLALPIPTPSQNHEAKSGGHDALQALLAFSSLHEQIRARRAAGSHATARPDDFVLYEVLQLVAERALALSEADGVAIALVQEGEVICRARTGRIAPEIGARLDPQCGLSGTCFLSGETVSCDDAENDPRVNIDASRNLHARSMVAVPLRGRRTVIGLLEAFSSNAFAFSDSDVRSLNLLAELILGAMKPEEEEKLEALSPAPLQSENPQPTSKGESFGILGHQAAEEAFLDIELPEDNSAPAAEIPPTLLRDYEKISTSRSSWRVVSAVVVVVLASVFWFLLWKFRSGGEPISAAAKAGAQAKQVPPVSYPAAAPVAVVADLPQPSPISPEDARRSVLPLVTGVRHWESGDSTTVAIDLQDQVQYEVHRLNSPERIYFDLHDAVLAPGLNGMSIEIGNDLLARIRMAEPVAGVARVVLDTKNVSNFSVGLEPNPYRLIIEVRRSMGEQKPKGDGGVLRPSATDADRLTSSVHPTSKDDQQLRAKVPHLRIVVDPGHGGWDLGTVGRQGVVEKDLVLEIAQRLGKLLESRLGCEILFTRTEDAYVPLEERAEIANDAQADLFVSVHANNSDYPSARGVETYYTNVSAPANSLEIEKRENATAMTVMTTTALSPDARKERTLQSRQLAASVERALYGTLSSKNPGVRDRGIKEAGFVVLTGTTMPAILAEISFVSSPADERNLQSTTYRQQIAEALYKGIAHYAAANGHVKLASAQ